MSYGNQKEYERRLRNGQVRFGGMAHHSVVERMRDIVSRFGSWDAALRFLLNHVDRRETELDRPVNLGALLTPESRGAQPLIHGMGRGVSAEETIETALAYYWEHRNDHGFEFKKF